MTNIEFSDYSFDGARKICPMCKADKSNPLLTVSNNPYIDQTLHMVRCESCGTCYYCDALPVLGYDHEDFDQSHWYTYVQSGAGITAMLEPLLAVEKPRHGNLLDVGCGFGYVPHFWATSDYGDAIGLETSGYGKLGSQKLGVNIIPKFYSDATEIHDEKFDYVFCSEVLEHVEEPQNFLSEVSSALAPDGILVLTTPSASVLNPSSDYFTILAALSPTFHFFLCSPQSLEETLKRCGYEYVKVHDFGHRLYAWASKVPLPNIKEGFSDWQPYFEYLEKLSHFDDPHVAGGALYRLMKDYHNMGYANESKSALERVNIVAKESFSIDLNDCEGLRTKIREKIPQGSDLSPSWLSSSILFSALINGDDRKKLRFNTDLVSVAIEGFQRDMEDSTKVGEETTVFCRLAKEAYFSNLELIESLASRSISLPSAFIMKYPEDIYEKDVCLFAAYSSDGKISEATRFLLDELSKQGIKIILCLALDDPTKYFDTSDLTFVDAVIIGKNGGFDFSMWSAGLRLIPECWSARRLMFLNDSVFLLPALLSSFLEKLRENNNDFVAATESFQHTHHAQSYFFMLQGESLASKNMRSYWEHIEPHRTKLAMVENHELKLLNRVTRDWGLSASIIFPMSEMFKGYSRDKYEKLNVSHQQWLHLVHCGLPFVKVELLKVNPVKVDIIQWQKLFELYGASVESALDHIAVPRGEKDRARTGWSERLIEFFRGPRA